MQTFLKSGDGSSFLHRGGVAQALIYATYFYLGAFGGDLIFGFIHRLLTQPRPILSENVGLTLVESGERFGVYGCVLGIFILVLWSIPGIFGPIKKGEGLCFTPIAVKAGFTASICVFTGVAPMIGHFILNAPTSLI